MGTVDLRPAYPADDAFLIRLYASTRRDIDPAGWGEAERDSFVKMQYEMRDRWYSLQWPKSEQNVIMFGNAEAGAMLIDRAGKTLTLIDIAVGPEFRRKGVGRAALLRLQDEARQGEQCIRLKVDKDNLVAIRLYESLAFERNGESELQLQLEWHAENAQK